MLSTPMLLTALITINPEKACCGIPAMNCRVTHRHNPTKDTERKKNKEVKRKEKENNIG